MTRVLTFFIVLQSRAVAQLVLPRLREDGRLGVIGEKIFGQQRVMFVRPKRAELDGLGLLGRRASGRRFRHPGPPSARGQPD